MNSIDINLEEIKNILGLSKEQFETRKAFLSEFNKSGFPSKKNEDWKFIDLNKIISSKIPNLKFFNNLVSKKIDRNEILENI